MDKEIKRLRNKFFRLSALIALIVIASMLLALNLLMQISYKNEKKSASDILLQTAVSNAPVLNKELICFDTLEKTEDGNYIIPRSIKNIKSVTMYGEITCSNHNASWYNAGGGLLFVLNEQSENEQKFVYKEYKFNKENTEITIDFSQHNDFWLESKPVDIDVSKLSEKYFLVSSVWWTSSSESTVSFKNGVNLNLESIEILYTDNYSVAGSDDYSILSRNFNDIYAGREPEILINNSCFYVITDKKNNIVEINSGNLNTSATANDLKVFLDSPSKEFVLGNIKYDYNLTSTDNLNIYTFIHNTHALENSRRLLMMSIVSGSGIYVVLLIVIYLISGAAVKPVTESYRKQKEFISNAGHELKTPITVISATTELIETKKGADALTECISAQAEKMSRLVNEMLTLTRLTESEKLCEEFEAFNISNVVGNSALYFESRAFEEGKTISANIEENLNMNGNADKIDELIGILLDNALKYSDEHAEISITLTAENNKLKLICKNPCSDFNSKSIPHLFDRFYRGDESHSNEKEGFGLGLSIAKEITDLHNGSISVEYHDSTVIFTAIFDKV